MKLTLTAMLFLTLLSLSAISADAAEPAIPALRTDIEFAEVGDVSLTLDAFVPEGAGPFPTCILVHGGGFVRGEKQSDIKPLFEPLSKAGLAWFTIDYRLAPQHRWLACAEDNAATIPFNEIGIRYSSGIVPRWCSLGSGSSVSVASVSSSTPATETAFSRAMRTTLVGSMMPASNRSTYLFVAASKP